MIVLIGASGSGKSTFAARRFLPTEIVSSDVCRALVGDDERDQATSADAFELMRVIAAKRLRHRRVTVLDATHVRLEQRAPLVALARRYEAPAIAIVFDVPEEVCLEANTRRPGRRVAANIVRRQLHDLRDSVRLLGGESFSAVHVFTSHRDAAEARVERV